MRSVALLLLLLVMPQPLAARRLAISSYTTAEGLARDRIRCVVQDSHGFLWFCTTEGLSRFDGYEFTNYRVEQGLPSNVVNAFLESSDGLYWVATEGGLCRFDAHTSPAARFDCLPVTGEHAVRSPWVLKSDGAGGIWCGTNSAPDVLLHLKPGEQWFRRVDFPAIRVTAIEPEPGGVLWVGSPEGLYRLSPVGSRRVLREAEGVPNDYIMALLKDRAGTIWVGTRSGLATISPQSQRITRQYGLRDGLPGLRIESLLETQDGALWAGTVAGLAERLPGAPRTHEFESYTLAQGLTARTVGSLTEDRDGNLWVGTFGSGAMKVARNGFTTFTEEDGASYLWSLFESRNHQLCSVARTETDLRLACFDGQRFRMVRPAWPRGLTYFGWGHGQIVAQDAAGEWWIATGHGLYRFARTESPEQLAGAHPIAVYGKRNGLPCDEIFRVFADSHEGIWIGTIGTHGGDGLARLDLRTGMIRAFADGDELHLPIPTWFTEDREGNVWIGLFHGGVARYRRGKFQVFAADEGIEGEVNALFTDSAGRIWISTSLGLVRADQPTAASVRFARLRSKDGLASDDIVAVTEDSSGRIWAATGRGIDRFRPEADGIGSVKHYTRADGIVPGELDLAFRDANGNLWFSTSLGVSRLVPGPDRAVVPPPVLITGVSVGGVAQPVSDLGAASVVSLRMPRAPLRISFVGLGYSPGESLRYQYRLQTADAAWSQPADQRSVTYANLSPGDYLFEVRAVAADGASSPAAATVSFTVLPPPWRSWWFLGACASIGGAAIYALHRHRLKRAVELAEVRARIATDLHDDIGASLSQIAILSEVAQHEVNGYGAPVREPLTAIAGISRQVIDSMSDIVWAIAPEHDRLTNLIYRMRRFASDLLAGQRIVLQFRTKIAEHDLKVDTDVRRQVYLIFKEAIHNIARHSGASRVEVELERHGRYLYLHISDNGVGFDPDVEHEGRGLRNIRSRAALLGGKAVYVSAPGAGTSLWLTLQLEPVRKLSALRGK